MKAYLHTGPRDNETVEVSVEKNRPPRMLRFIVRVPTTVSLREPNEEPQTPTSMLIAKYELGRIHFKFGECASADYRFTGWEN